MNRVDRTPGVRLVTDHPAAFTERTDLLSPPPEFPAVEDDREDRDLVALAGRLNTGVAVQLILDRASGETFVTTVVAGDALTVRVEGENAWDVYCHPGFYGLLPQLAK